MEINLCLWCGKATLKNFCSRTCLQAHVENEKKLANKKCSDRVVLAIPDLHAPFIHKDAFDFLSDIKAHYKPEIVVCLGDELDEHAFSEYHHDPDGLSPGQEMMLGIQALKPLYKLFPNMELMTSNHTSRYLKKAFKAGLPSMVMRKYKELFHGFDGWRWHDHLILDNVRYFHGEPFTGDKGHINAMKQFMMSVCMGHIHAHAGVYYYKTGDRQLLALNCGWLGDEYKYAQAYGKQFPQKPILGCGIIVGGRTACFIPMV